MTFLALIPNWLKIAAGGLLCLGVVAVSSYLVGKRVQRAEMAVDSLQQVIKSYKSRSDTNARIESLDRTQLCVELGVPIDRCRAEFQAATGD